MHFLRPVLPALLLLTLSQACSPGNSRKDPVAEAKFENEKRIGDEAVTKKQEHDAEFMVTAASDGMLETELAKLMQQKAAAPATKSLAQLLLTEHSDVGNALQALAGRKSIVLPSGLSEDQQAQYKEAAGLTGLAFDKKCLDLLIEGNKQGVSAFEDMSNDAYDGDIRGFAAKYLPLLKDHLTKAKDVREQLDKQP